MSFPGAGYESCLAWPCMHSAIWHKRSPRLPDVSLRPHGRATQQFLDLAPRHAMHLKKTWRLFSHRLSVC